MGQKVGHYNNLTINVREYMLCAFNVWIHNFTSLIRFFSKNIPEILRWGEAPNYPNRPSSFLVVAKHVHGCKTNWVPRQQSERFGKMF